MSSGGGNKIVAESVSAKILRRRLSFPSFLSFASSPVPASLSTSLSSSLSTSLPASLYASIHASRAVVPVLLAEAAAFALAAGSGKIPAFLFTVVRALLTF